MVLTRLDDAAPALRRLLQRTSLLRPLRHLDGSTPRAAWLAAAGSALFSAAATGLIWAAGRRLAGVPHLPDRGPSWYYWKLPKPSTAARLSAWGLYAGHQLAVWGLVAYGQRRVGRYARGLHPLNVVALGVNGGFILLHVAQTHVWYDGLAQDVSIWSALGSVALLLVVVLVMENRRRGLFFGRRAPIPGEVVRFLRRYHGYYFAWATVYTFWYHPAENTPGHLAGFFYMFLLLLQGSLFYTRVHVNRWWTLLLELLVLVHGTLLAIMQRNGLWPMFAFGFGGVFVVTQMHGVGLSRAARALLGAGYAAGAALVYRRRGWRRLNEIARIPLIDYAAAGVLAGLVGGGQRLVRAFGARSALPARGAM